MSTMTATVPTANASRYLQQLCKHWSHKFEVSFDAAQGLIQLPGATLALRAGDAALALDLSNADDADLTRLCGVVEDHVRRFAFREDLAFAWTPRSG